jgi:hypothetical protein
MLSLDINGWLFFLSRPPSLRKCLFCFDCTKIHTGVGEGCDKGPQRQIKKKLVNKNIKHKMVWTTWDFFRKAWTTSGILSHIWYTPFPGFWTVCIHVTASVLAPRELLMGCNQDNCQRLFSSKHPATEETVKPSFKPIRRILIRSYCSIQFQLVDCMM